MNLNNTCTLPATYFTVDNMDAEMALQQLKEGNDRYIFDHVEHPHEGAQRRVDVSIAQHPFAVVLGCGDSRVIPEMIFDQGVGDLFVLRIAGNIADDAVIASIEFAIQHLGVRLVVVLGHEKCGAVTAAIAHEVGSSKINSLLSYIEPAIGVAQSQSGNLLTNAIKVHVKRMVNLIAKSEPVLAHEYRTGNLKVLPAYYNLATGIVDFLDH
ncbi:carbonic anhydrase [Synechococcus sp. PCC 7502]|uniref:carbonic anhydrase n=1 Tax=Synechococcus sp. PCC 7502 TaxID=1173263 RepID=UPI00029FF370|nr:carbonic anhydrase [Synechococcus sp. PCC 7502]AFY74415.1 carbonic anhydrase [Synechococcus sp. PCC 7502]